MVSNGEPHFGWTKDQLIIERLRDELRAKGNDLLDILLSPNGGESVVPFELGEAVASAVEWLIAEVGSLRRQVARWESGQRRKFLPVVESVPDGHQYAALLLRAQGTEGGEEHDDLLREAALRLKTISDAAAYLLAERAAERDVIEAAKAWREFVPATGPTVQHRAHAAAKLAAAVDALPQPVAAQCCDLHGRNCEPPSELCCWSCTEASHPEHRDGSVCSAPDLSRSQLVAEESTGGS